MIVNTGTLCHFTSLFFYSTKFPTSFLCHTKALQRLWCFCRFSNKLGKFLDKFRNRKVRVQFGKVSPGQILTAKLCQVRSIRRCEKSLCAVCRQIVLLCSANWKTHSRSRLVHNLKPTSPNNCCSARLFFFQVRNIFYLTSMITQRWSYPIIRNLKVL